MDKITDLKRKQDESELQYIWRLCSAKDSSTLDMTWSELASVLNKELRADDEEWTESAYRKKYQQAKIFYEEVFSKMESDTYNNELMVQKRELERLKIAFRDERNAWQRQNYADKRAEETLELLEIELKQLGNANFEVHDTPIISSENEMVICLSDLHIGQ